MKRFAVHNTGDYVRDRNGNPTREQGTVKEYDTLEGMHPFDRQQFEWMLEHGEIVISMGATVYQIRRAA